MNSIDVKVFFDGIKEVDKKPYNHYKLKDKYKECILELVMEENKLRKNQLVRLYLNSNNQNAIELICNGGIVKEGKEEKYIFSFKSSDDLIKVKIQATENLYKLKDTFKIHYNIQPTLEDSLE